MGEQNTLRDTLEANFDAASNNTLDVAPDAPAIETPVVEETTEQIADRERDEKGRFATKTEKVEAPVVETIQPVQETQLQRPTTWKKDYLPIWDKLATGNPLTPEEAKKLAEYSNQRETEYKTGVSTYKAEADQARQLQDAINPFMPVLQQHNMQPAQWISKLGNAHLTLVQGSPEQKLQMFAKLAQEYGVPLQAVSQAQQGQMDPNVSFLMQQIQNLSGQVNTVTSWREQQEQQVIQQEIAKFQDAEKYPYFEQVRGDIIQLLEKGLAPDLETAYNKAVRFNDEVYETERQRQAQTHESQTAQHKAAVVAKAKSQTVSVKSTTPSGSTATDGTKDRRAILAEQVEAFMGGRV